MNAGATVRDGRRAWRLLRSNPDYVADWRTNGGPVAHEPAPFPLRRHTVADLEAARWNLLAWEAPWLNEHAAPFWAGVPMLEGRALDVGEVTEHALFRVVVRSGATLWGLRLRDGGLILRVMRGRKAEQIKLADGGAFDPARSALEIAPRAGASSPSEWTRGESLDATVFARQTPGRMRDGGFSGDQAEEPYDGANQRP